MCSGVAYNNERSTVALALAATQHRQDEVKTRIRGMLLLGERVTVHSRVLSLCFGKIVVDCDSLASHESCSSTAVATTPRSPMHLHVAQPEYHNACAPPYRALRGRIASAATAAFVAAVSGLLLCPSEGFFAGPASIHHPFQPRHCSSQSCPREAATVAVTMCSGGERYSLHRYPEVGLRGLLIGSSWDHVGLRLRG